MDMFEKATRVAKNVGENVVSSAKSFGTSLYSSTKEQSELAGLKVQKSVIEKSLTDSYAEIGRRYVTYVNQCDGGMSFDVEDLLEMMRPDLEKLEEVKQQITEKEQQIKKCNEEKAQKKAQEEFDAEKSKLDEALAMDIISTEEYEEKMEAAQRKFDNYEQLRKIQLQLQMGIITRAEYEEKVKKILQ